MTKPVMEFGNTNSTKKDSQKDSREIKHMRILDTNNNANIKVTTIKSKRYRSELCSKYSLPDYDLCPNYGFPEELHGYIPRNTPFFVNGAERYLERLIRALHVFKQCTLIGPSGTGKTHITYLVSEIAGLPLWEMNCNYQTSVNDMFGKYVETGKDSWVDGPVVSWARHGGVLCLDEANMMKPDIATRLNSVLEPAGHIVLTEKDGEIIPRHEFAYVIVTMNPFSDEFAGTKPMNRAFRRRMGVWVNFDYLSVGSKITPQEVTLVQDRSSVSEEVAKKIVHIAAELRVHYKDGKIPYAPSVGDLVNWGKLICHGEDPQTAAEETIVAATSDSNEVQNSVRKVIKIFFGDQFPQS